MSVSAKLACICIVSVRKTEAVTTHTTYLAVLFGFGFKVKYKIRVIYLLHGKESHQLLHFNQSEVESEQL